VAGVPQPRWAYASAPGEGPALAAELGYPCVVKAPDRQGQRGLTLVERPEELPAAIERALAAARNGGYLVEEHVPGPEVTVNAFLVGGAFHALTVTDREVAAPPAFGVALAHVWPPARPADEAVDVARAAAAALGLTDGAVYVQLVVGPDGPRLVELAARLGGGHDAELCEAATGVDLNGLALDAALGAEPTVPPPGPQAAACVRFLVAPEGELAAVHGLAEARAVPGVVDALAYRHPGWRFGPLRTGTDRAGYVLATGAGRDEALAHAALAAALVRFERADA
jgi:cysteine synthase A